MRLTGKLLLCSMLASGLLFSVTGCAKKKNSRKQAKIVRVSIAPMAERDFKQRIPVLGTVNAVETATISSRTEGTLDMLPAAEGTRVRKGEVMFQIDRKNLANAVTVAQRALDVCIADVKTAQISLDLSDIQLQKREIDYNRARTLVKSSAVSKDNYESAELDYKKAKAEHAKATSVLDIAKALVEKQRNNLSIAQKNLADSEIRAPFDGTVLETYVDPGEFVKNGSQILRLENLDQLQVKCFISSLYYDSIVPGKTRALFRVDDAPAGHAVVTYRAPFVDPLSRTFLIKIRLPKNTPLVRGLMCNVDLLTKERHGFGLPSDAIQLRGNNVHVAFAVKDGKAEQVVVKPGITDGNVTEILNAQEFRKYKFVVRGQTFVNPGDTLSILKELDPSCF